jgi:hypothetical protein
MTHQESTDGERSSDSPQGPAASAQHQPSHLDQLNVIPDFPSDSDRLGFWGIVVPTARPLGISSGLACASRLATEWDTHLVVLRSGAAAHEPFPRSLVPRTSHPIAVIDLPAAAEHLLPAWRSSSHPVATLDRDSDLALKRNFGVLLARMGGPGKAMLFLDDDVAPVSSDASARSEGWTAPLRMPDVLAAFAAFPELRAAAWVERDFPDNSVVCHARRLVGMEQDVFVSGGAMMVRIDAPLPRFSKAYNEDWFFLFELMSHESPSGDRSRRVQRVGDVRQDPYRPFKIVRARSEELGDIIAEGLFAVACRSREEILLAATSGEFWKGRIIARQRMIEEVLEKLRENKLLLRPNVFVGASAALYAGLDIHAGDPAGWAQRLAEFVALHLADAADWSDLLAGVTPAPGADLTLEEGVSALGLAQYVTWYGGGGRRTCPLVGRQVS